MSALEMLGENAPAFSDEDLALRFAGQHADDLRFVAAWNRWLVWDGKNWQFEETLRAWDFARQICRDAATQCHNKPKEAGGIASAKTVYAVERLARSDRGLAATIDQWDTDPWQLNTPQGVIDLTTGQSRPHIPEDYITKITAVAPKGECPRFLAFLDRITGGDSELVAYIQRVLGYGLTGLTREHALFFGYGTGANGKSVLLSTVAGILGDYHKTAPIETFTASKRIVTRLIWPACAARASSPQPKLKRVAAGPSLESSSSPAATRLRPASCARISSSIGPRLS